MVDGFYKIVTTILHEFGYRYQSNAKGSHEKWKHPDKRQIILVPRNLMSRHTANGILKDAETGRKI
jgi:predicted RNA binding protein YcfA (HicA-like mRNA interferase family)